MEKQIQWTQEDIERMLREYRGDSFIEGCRKKIADILHYSKPYIAISLSADRSKDAFDIDEESKNKIKYWQEQIDEYVKSHYSDLVTKQN